MRRFGEAAVVVRVGRERPVIETVLCSVGRQRPAVVGAFDDEVDLVAALRPVLRFPKAPRPAHRQALRIPMAHTVDLSSALPVQQQYLAVIVVRLLRKAWLRQSVGAEVPGGEKQLVVGRPRQPAPRLEVVEVVRHREARLRFKDRRPFPRRAAVQSGRVEIGRRDAERDTFARMIPILVPNDQPDRVGERIEDQVGYAQSRHRHRTGVISDRLRAFHRDVELEVLRLE